MHIQTRVHSKFVCSCLMSAKKKTMSMLGFWRKHDFKAANINKFFFKIKKTELEFYFIYFFHK